MKVKGTAIVDLIRIMRSEKNRDFSSYLKPEDLEIVNGYIAAARWYPGDSFWRISHAVAKEVGKLQKDNMIYFGRLSAKSYLKVYKRLVVPGDPAASLEGCVAVWSSFYDFEGAAFKKNDIEKGDDWLKFKVYDYPNMIIPEMRVPYFLGLAGYYLEIAEQSLGRKIKYTITDNGDNFEMTYNWG